VSNFFSKVLEKSRRVDANQYATDFGGIVDDVVSMLSNPIAKETMDQARAVVEGSKALPNGIPRLFRVEFGGYHNAPELQQGKVAAVDGTLALPMQRYAAGQALCVGVGSISHQRSLSKSLQAWSSIALDAPKTAESLLSQTRTGLFGLSQTAFMRYYEALHGLEIEEPFVLFDGPLVYEWLVSTKEGRSLYMQLLGDSPKKCIGIIKSLKFDNEIAWVGRALKPGEVYVFQTLRDHLEDNPASNKNHGEVGMRWAALPKEFHDLSTKILRGVFKPRTKAFGFEVHIDHLQDLIRIMAADCQMNASGHEIPYLLNRIDQEIRAHFNQRILADRIASQLRKHSDELFFEETDERSFRS
jgi:hypothetical protein